MKIAAVVRRPRALPFKGDAEALNELVKIGRQSADALQNLFAIAEFKRDDRTAYQRQYMAQRRERERKVIRIEEWATDRKLTLDQRKDLLHKRYAEWESKRSKHTAKLHAQFKRENNREPTWQETQSFVRDFWVAVDLELARMMDEIQRVESSPKRAKRVVKVTPKVSNPTFQQALQKAFTKR